MLFKRAIACIVASSIAVAANSSSSNSTNPCAILSASEASQTKARASEVLLKPSEVYACLQDVPINKTLAVDQIDWIQQFMSFQSTLAYLKKPPSSYPFEPVDVVGGLDSIRQKADAGNYTNEYDFEYDIYTLLAKTNEGHLSFAPLLLYAFLYVKNAPLVSFSVEPSDLPKVYFLSDIESDDTSYTPGSIVSIDGKPVDEAILESGNGLQDEDALYNTLFYNAATSSQDPFKGKYNLNVFIVHSDTSTYKLSNGTTRVIENSVIPKLPLKGVESGQDIFDIFLDPAVEDSPTPTNTTAPPSTSTTPASKPTATAPDCKGCIEPFISDEGNTILGYFLPSDPSVAVLNIPSFAPPDPSEFQFVVQDFLAKSAEAKKTRLVLDIRGNTGGTAFLGYDTFKQLFPTKPIRNRNRFRVHPTAEVLGKTFSQLSEFTVADIDAYLSLDAATQDNATSTEVATVLGQISPFNYHTSLKRNGQEFSSWEDLSDAQSVYGDNFTEVLAWQFNNTALDLLTSRGIVVSGFANNTDIADQVFDISNITVLTDAACASTCALFTNLLLEENVSSIAIGGRPYVACRSKSPMAAVGGTQGTQVLKVSALQSAAHAALAIQASNNQTQVNTLGAPVNATASVYQASQSEIDLLTALTQPPPIKLAGGVAGQSVNFKDNLGIDGDVPLQFQKGVRAGCRVFYSSSDVLFPQTLWAKIAASDYECVDGGKKPWGKSKGSASAPTEKKSAAVALGWSWGVVGVSALAFFL